MELVTRLARRLTKALSHGARAGTITRDTLTKDGEAIQHLRVASSKKGSTGDGGFGTHGWDEWDAARAEMDECLKRRDACLDGLSRMPIFFKPL